jgi:hypothetical protein
MSRANFAEIQAMQQQIDSMQAAPAGSTRRAAPISNMALHQERLPVNPI